VTEQKQLKQGRVDAYYHYYNIANKNVAELCNHQRATPASHNAALEKMDEKINKVKQELADAKKAKNASKVTSLTARVDKMLSDREVKDETKARAPTLDQQRAWPRPRTRTRGPR
jgi:hypothetical protein